jgi:hypothetical protein
MEVSEPLAEPWLAELAIYERCLHTNALLDILEDEAIPVRPKHDAKIGTLLMQLVPAPELAGSKRGTERLLGPAREAVDALMGFAVRRSLRHSFAIAHSGLKRREAKLDFEDTPRGEELLMIPRWRVNPKGLRMDLVDGHVDVFVVFIVVPGGDILVARKPQSLHKVFHNTPELVPV